ncbi:hypothetical protein FKM82_003062 [Ascaphus truei]
MLTEWNPWNCFTKICSQHRLGSDCICDCLQISYEYGTETSLPRKLLSLQVLRFLRQSWVIDHYFFINVDLFS